MSFTLRAATPADAAALSVFAGENFPDAAPAVVPREAVEAFITENLSEEVLEQAIASGVYTVNLVLDTEGQNPCLLGDRHGAAPAGRGCWECGLSQ